MTNELLVTEKVFFHSGSPTVPAAILEAGSQVRAAWWSISGFIGVNIPACDGGEGCCTSQTVGCRELNARTGTIGACVENYGVHALGFVKAARGLRESIAIRVIEGPG